MTFNRLIVLFALYATLSVGVAYAQIDLKELRALPDTNIVNKAQAPVNQLNNIIVPIPNLDLEVDYWKHWTKFGINANQAAFSGNWNAGGVNSVAAGLLGWHKSEYNKNNFQFTTEIDLKYGIVRNEGQLAKKNNDRIFWDNKLAYKLSKSWALYFSLTFESQFDVGYKYKFDDDLGRELVSDTVSNFMAPGYFTESFGLEYKPDESFSVRFGTGTARQTLLLNRERLGAEPDYGVEPGKEFKNDLAFQLTANLDRNLSKNFNIKSRYNLFADYNDIGDPDHRLDVTLTTKVTNLVNVSLGGILVYNSDEAPDVQYSQALALGITYTLPR